MSYCYDTLEKAWAFLRRELPPETRDGELADRFEFLLFEMHEANHRLKDAINHDARVTRSAQRLDRVLTPYASDDAYDQKEDDEAER